MFRKTKEEGPQRPLKLRRWVLTSTIAAVLLLIGVSVMVAIVVTNNKRSSAGVVSESRANATNSTNTSENNAPVTTNGTFSAPSAVPLSIASPSIQTDLSSVTPTPLNVTDINATMSPTTQNLTEETTVPAPVPLTNAPIPPTSPSPTYLNEPTTTIFYAHGDIPYEDPQTVILEAQMKSVPLDAEFVIFVGDLRDAGEDKPCLIEDYTSASYLFRMSHAPVFVIQGDNDISDCPNYEEGKKFWQDEFIGFEGKYWNHTFDIKRHEGYPDDFAFVHKKTLFMGLNIIGGETRNETEWETRLGAEAVWTTDLIRAYHMNSTEVGRVVIFGHANPGVRHATYFQTVSSFIRYELNNSIPIVYINGDKHEWDYTPNFYDSESWLRIGVTGLGAEPLLKVTVEADGTYIDPQQAFEIDRML